MTKRLKHSFIQISFGQLCFLEYVDLNNCIHFMLNNLAKKGVIFITIQSNNVAVSESGVKGVKLLSGQFKRIDKEIVMNAMVGSGLTIIDKEENILPNGKTFLTFIFQR